MEAYSIKKAKSTSALEAGGFSLEDARQEKARRHFELAHQHYRTAIKHFEEAYREKSLRGVELLLCQAYIGQGDVLEVLKNPEAALRLYRKAKSLGDEQADLKIQALLRRKAEQKSLEKA